MLFSDGACSRRVSLFKFFLFSAKMRTAQREREREKELGVGKERENFVFVVLFCFVWNAAGGGRGKRPKQLSSFLGIRKRNEFLGMQNFFFFFETPRKRTNINTQAGVRALLEDKFFPSDDRFLKP